MLWVHELQANFSTAFLSSFKLPQVFLYNIIIVSNSNWTRWSTIQEVIAQVISKSDKLETNLKL